jgi:cell pole-organizing protein PopZ
MRMGQLNHEPSMEDILASIKRIIAEDSEAVGARTPRARREAMTAVASVPAPLPEPEPAPLALVPEVEADDDHPTELVEETHVEAVMAPPEADLSDDPEIPDVLELTSPMPEADTIPAPTAKAAAPASDPATDGLLSSPAAQASRNAFAALGQLQVRAEEGAPNTLDGLVGDLLKPMLREWLDRELPALVERLVAAEVARLSGRG